MVRDAAEGAVVYVTMGSGKTAALVSLEIAAAGAAAVHALEDAQDARDAPAALAEPGESIPWEQVKAEAGL